VRERGRARGRRKAMAHHGTTAFITMSLSADFANRRRTGRRYAHAVIAVDHTEATSRQILAARASDAVHDVRRQKTRPQ